MDLFGRKAKAELARLNLRVHELEDENISLNIRLRELDQAIFNMAQKTSWEDMRPLFAELCKSVNIRMVAEHKRISNILIPELNRTYGK